MSTLVIVESPTKARTIRKYLPNDYRVEASMGHVRDLPSSAKEVPAKVKEESWGRLGVNVEEGFKPVYVVPTDKKKVVRELKAALKEADELILATDEDREGESISWHLKELLNPKVPTKRMVFHEITREAIQEALKHCRDVDNDLVEAQETRRILDRLYGYTLSPLLWKKVARGLSAGRVQSVAVRLIVEKERERRAFKSGSYWDLKATLEQKKSEFEAKLTTLGGKKLATGSDFDPKTGKIAKGRDVVLLNEAEANALKDRLSDKQWTVKQVEERPTTRKPSPPFTTSTLQQESNRKLKISARDTMRTAQSLYENGYITYMRTDSVHLSEQAISAARTCVTEKYGKEYLSPKPRQYSTKSKGAQEAHEAIRPAGETFRSPQETGLQGRELALYDLIWKRTIASQMANAKLTQISVQLAVEDAEFRSSGKRIDFAGFFRAYVEGSDDPEAALENQEVILPDLKEGDHPNCKNLESLGHETQPPARYTEASLVKMLESEGIGRPSTYASIISTIIDRGYVQMRGNALTPTFTAFAVTSLLEQYFGELVDPHFTARMEKTLDHIAAGKADSTPYLEKFYFGEKGLNTLVEEKENEIDSSNAKAVHLDNIDVKIKIGYFGPYLETENGDGVVTASIPQDLTPADLNPEQVEVLLRQKTEGPDQVGIHPETGDPIFIKIGRYGPYVELGEETEGKKKPKRCSLPKGTQPEDVTLEMAVKLLSLPRHLGEHPTTGAPIKTAIGPYGPYVVHDQGKEGKDYRSLKKEDDVLSIELNRALELLSQPKKSRRGNQKELIKELGNHPDNEKPVKLYKGPHGPYINHGRKNASLPEGESPDKMTLERAVELLAEKTKTSSKTTAKSKTGTKKNTGTKTKTTRKKKTE
ncbi:type I DNA topoisomerase [Dactylococcopsis salina]|uniref:DNA topoisomerase 1 n=1 Tax=Dactylococcopsis salina (strain PCC 8305) TaxID=13035 RepID=K9YTZ5_DACS8|nr:type I DNA topoisomerase [Dactylococcopsis salina]AFZ50364.1 DNA topoisomerase I, bacterial [Dactylococcopsis salina PCC 8305]